MPNGGLHHCGNCRHLNRESSQCSLRKIIIETPHWTTCRDVGKRTDAPHGSVYSIVCEVKNRAGSYCDIPWFQGNRVDTIRSRGGTTVVVTGSDGERHEFPDVAAYMEFWEENTSEDDQ